MIQGHVQVLANNCQSSGRKPSNFEVSILKVKKTGGHELGQAEPQQEGKTLDCLDLCSVFSLFTNQLILSRKQKESETKKQTYQCARKSTPDQLTRWMTSSGCWTSPKPNFLICKSLGHRWSRDTRHKVNSKSLAKTGCSTVLGGRYYISWGWQSSQSQQAWTLPVIRLLRQSAAACDTKDGAQRTRKSIRPSHRVQASYSYSLEGVTLSRSLLVLMFPLSPHLRVTVLPTVSPAKIESSGAWKMLDTQPGTQEMVGMSSLAPYGIPLQQMCP